MLIKFRNLSGKLKYEVITPKNYITLLSTKNK